MVTSRILPCFLVLLTAVAVSTGCKAQSKQEEGKVSQQELTQQLTTLKQDYAALLQTRRGAEPAVAELATLEAKTEAARSPQEQARIGELKATLQPVEAAYDALQTKLADFLTAALNDYPTTAETAEGLKIYAEEAMVFADEAVNKAGDYKKAIDQLSAAAGYFQQAGLAAYQPLAAKLAQLEDRRYLTQARYDQVQKGMTREDVKRVLGPPYYRNVSEIPDKKVIRWLYPKVDGGAGAIYFKLDTGTVYSKDFDAVKTKVVREGGN